MAAADTKVVQVAEAMIQVATALKSANVLMSQTLPNNSAHAIDWNTTTALDGKDYTGAEISNVIGSFAAFGSAFWDAGHSQNIELLVKPIV